MPVDPPTLATPEALEDQEPPGIASESVVVDPRQTAGTPEMSGGVAFTVRTAVANPPTGDAYEIIEVPGETPTARPDPRSMVATEVSELNQWPPTGVSMRAVVDPTHMDKVPIMGPIANDLTDRKKQDAKRNNILFIRSVFCLYGGLCNYSGNKYRP